MTADEVQRVLDAVNARWPHQRVPQTSYPAWLQDLAEKPYGDAMAAVVVLSREGREFPPTCGQVRQRLDQLALGAPAFDEAWRCMRDFMARYGTQRSTAEMPWPHPLIGTLARSVGWYEFGQTLQDDLATFRAQARRMWDTIVQRQFEGLAFGDIEAPLPGLRHGSGAASIGAVLASPTLGVDDGSARTLARGRDAS